MTRLLVSSCSKVPFEQIIDPVIFEEIDEARDRKSTSEYRIFPVKQDELLLDGCENIEEDRTKDSSSTAEGGQVSTGPLIKVAKYIGNKWGGKYLRALDIYWTILEKGKGKLV